MVEKSEPQRPELRYAVHDIPDEDGVMHVFLPGDDVPEWAQRYITNPNCWAVAPASAKPRAASRKKPADSGEPEA